jgi:hypothetical protein
MFEPAVACVGMRSGVRIVDIDPVTFMPLRVVTMRGGKLAERITTTRFRRATGALPAIRFRGRHNARSLGFVAATPQQIASLGAPYRVAMPLSLPDGFGLVTTGSALDGPTFGLGPDGDVSGGRGVFAAQWQRGLETIDLTMRTGTDTSLRAWNAAEPFGYSCFKPRRAATMVSGHPASYALYPYGGARLWWRDGLTMYTLTAPLPRAELVRIAESLETVDANG